MILEEVINTDNEVKVGLTSPRTIQILAVDDDTALGEITKEFLQATGNVDVDVAESVAEARLAIVRRQYDAIVCDYQMPDEDGIQFLKSLRSSGDKTPFILFTGKGREEIVIEALNNGADAYLQKGGEPKPLFVELEHRIGTIVQRHRAESALQDSESEFRTLFEDNPDPVVLVSLDGKILNTNQAGSRMVLMSKEEIIGGTISDMGVFIEDDVALFKQSMTAMVNGEPVSPVMTQVHRKDGTIRLVEIRASVVMKAGRFHAIQIIGRDITERMRIEEALRKSNNDLQAVNSQLAAAEKELRQQLDAITQGEDELKKEMTFSESLVESLPGIFYVYDAASLRLVRWNKNHREVSGYTDDEMFGKHVLDWHRTENAEAVLAAINNVMAEGQGSIEAPLVMKDGREVPYLLTGRRFDTKQHPFFLGVGVDIAERKETDSRLLRMNRELVAIKECDRALVKAETEQELLDEVCRIVCEVAGYRLAWIGMAEHDERRTVRPVAWSGHDNGYVAQIRATWAGDERGLGPTGMSIRTGTTVFIQDFDNDAHTGPWREMARNNGYRSSIGIPLLDSGAAFGTFMLYSDRVNGFTADEVSLLEEMTDDLAFGILSLRAKERQVKAEETLRKGRERYTKLMATIPDLVIMTDLTGNIVMMNEPTLRQSGYASEEVIGHSLFSFMAPEDVDKAIKNAEMKIKGKVELVEFHLIMKDGRRVLFEANGDVLRDSDGKPTGFVFVGRDVTERRHLESMLKEANRKLRVMDSITRHDITNQLMVLSGHLSLLEKKQPDHKSDEHLRKAEAAADSITAMIRFTKEYENVGVKTPAWQDIRTLTEMCTKEVILGQLNVINDVPAGRELFADPMIIKVFHNLIENVIRHGGKITTIRFYLEERDGVVAIVCEDDGVGIPAYKKKKLFSKGFGNDHGLGLFLSREILSITGITITEEGEPGKGAKFVITIPNDGFRAA